MTNYALGKLKTAASKKKKNKANFSHTLHDAIEAYTNCNRTQIVLSYLDII